MLQRTKKLHLSSQAQCSCRTKKNQFRDQCVQEWSGGNGVKRMGRSDTRRVDEAHARILKWIRVTPIIRMQGPGARPVVLKLECLQRSGSFKLRGALNKLMALGDKADGGVITASGGNHGLGVAWAGWLLGRPVNVTSPKEPHLQSRHDRACKCPDYSDRWQLCRCRTAARDAAADQGIPTSMRMTTAK